MTDHRVAVFGKKIRDNNIVWCSGANHLGCEVVTILRRPLNQYLMCFRNPKRQ